jgi:membrane protein
MPPLHNHVLTFFQQDIWTVELHTLPRWQRLLYLTIRMAIVIGRVMSGGELNLHAMSLVYTTLLSLVPLLAVSFSVLKAFGIHNQATPLLLQLLEPLGPKAEQIVSTIISFVENINVGVLGALGIALLFYTVISLISKIENTFNYIWKVPDARRWLQRFSDYFSVILIGPVLVFSALALTASMTSAELAQKIISIEPFGTAFYTAGILAPYLLTTVAFAFIYIFIPNTSVRPLPAVAGAAVATVLWNLTGWMFATFIVSSTNYNAIYSGFATLIMLLVWLYLSWLIFILGAQFAFYFQNPAQIRQQLDNSSLSNSLKEKLALTMMFWIGHHYYYGLAPWTLDTFMQKLGIPEDSLGNLLEALKTSNLIIEATATPGAYVPARDLDSIFLTEVLLAVRNAGDNTSQTEIKPPVLSAESAVEVIMARLDKAASDTLKNQTVRHWIIESRVNQNAASGINNGHVPHG